MQTRRLVTRRRSFTVRQIALFLPLPVKRFACMQYAAVRLQATLQVFPMHTNICEKGDGVIVELGMQRDTPFHSQK